MKDISVTKIKPTRGYVLVEPSEFENKTPSGIYLPDSATEKPSTGKVLAVGDAIFDDGKEVNSPVKVGDVVIYKKWGGNEIKIGDKEYQFLKFEDLLATLS